MISYDTPANIARRNAEADATMERHKGVDRKAPQPGPAVAPKVASALAMRQAG